MYLQSFSINITIYLLIKKIVYLHHESSELATARQKQFIEDVAFQFVSQFERAGLVVNNYFEVSESF